MSDEKSSENDSSQGEELPALDEMFLNRRGLAEQGSALKPSRSHLKAVPSSEKSAKKSAGGKKELT